MQKVVTEQKELTQKNDLPEGAILIPCQTAGMLKKLFIEVAEIKKMVAKQMPDKSAVIDNADLMKDYHISRTTAAEWRQKGLEFFKTGAKIFYTREAISIFLNKHKHRGF